MVEQQLQADGTAHRIPGIAERPAGLGSIEQHALDQLEYPGSQLGERERDVHRTIATMSGQVPGHQVIAVGEPGRSQ